jgi:glycosyltransferase involved in cell wall biosynthesis
MTRPKIAIILRTNGLEYDDRVRKECISLSKVADLTLFVSFESNKEEEGITAYGVPYKSFPIKLRDILPAGKLLLLKAFEFYWRVRKHLKGYDLIWAHEEYTFMFPLFAPKSRFIWDLHEIPTLFDRPILRQLFRLIESRSKRMIHGNQFRINHMIKMGLIRKPEKHVFIRNLPDGTFQNSTLEPENYELFKQLLNNEPYVYLQGISAPDRHPYNTIASVLKKTTFKIVIVGRFQDADLIKRLHNEFGTSIDKRLIITGMVNQLSTPFYLREATFSMVFYQTTTPNERYCEANRFYQSLIFGVPIITGSNEPMSEIINVYKCGIALESDGSNRDHVESAIEKLLDNYNEFKQNTVSASSNFVWKDEVIDSQWINVGFN